MGTQVNLAQQLNYYKNKRNLFLFFIIFPLSFIISFYFINFFFDWVNQSVLDTILLLFLLVYLLLVSVLKARLNVYSMYYNYYSMLIDEIGIQTLQKTFDIEKFRLLLNKKGYTIKINNKDFDIYTHSLLTKNNDYFQKNEGVLHLVLIKNDTIKLYNETIENALQQIYRGLESEKKVIKHRINLVLKPLPSLDLDIQTEFQKIINIQHGKESLIQINIAVLNNEKKIYYLSPKKRFPNRAYYEAVHEIKRLLSLK